MVDGRTTDGRTDDDGRRLDGYTISSPCEPNGSGELKIYDKYIMIWQVYPVPVSALRPSALVLVWESRADTGYDTHMKTAIS